MVELHLKHCQVEHVLFAISKLSTILKKKKKKKKIGVKHSEASGGALT